MFYGSLVALITPFDARGRVDTARLRKLVRWQVAEGTEGIVCAGATGESMTLSEAERKKILQVCLEETEKKIPVIVGTGTSDTRQTVRLTEKAKEWGADGCLVITPYYNKPTQRGCVLHFQAISGVGLPIILYNNPARVVVQLSPETIADIALLPNVVALKESTHDSTFLRRVRAVTKLPILAGEDGLTLEMLREGAVGSISPAANVVPGLWKKMVQAARKGAWDEAEALFEQVRPLCQALSLETNPQCVKYAVSLLGRCRAAMRLPLVEPMEASKEAVRKGVASRL